MRNFFKKSGRPKDLVKSLSLPSHRTQLCDDRTATDGDGAASNALSVLNHLGANADSDILRAAEQYCNSQNADFWQCRKHLSRPIMRIVNDKECLGYFVQFLDTKSALPFIKFWIDADSFKVSAELCLAPSAATKCEKRWRSLLARRPQSANSDRSDLSPRRRVLSKSVSLNIGGAFERGCDRDDALSLSTYSEMLDSELTSNEQRDVGDGSSQTNSMTNVSDICDYGPTEFRIKCRSTDTNEQENDAEAETSGGEDSASPCSCNGAAEGRTDATPARMRDIHSDLVTDAKRIFQKYLIGLDAPYRVEVSAAILSKITTGLGRSDEPTAAGITAIATIFVEAQHYVLNQLEADYLDAFLESSFYHCHCMETLTGDAVHVADILYNEAALFYFMEFVEQDHRREYFDFWISAVNFRRQFASDAYDARQAQSDALVLYEKFFSLQATHPLHLSDCIRFGVEERICAENGRIDDCFDVPLAVVERYLAERYLQPFIKSPLFERFLTELRRKTDGHVPHAASINVAVGDGGQFGRKYSDCSGDMAQHAIRRSISSKNTLLAMDGSKKRRSTNALRSPPFDSNMLIDARQLYDPDLLWRRNIIPGLSFGRIDELGRYERNYETAPLSGVDAGGLATSSKLKQAVRKLVNLREDSVQQEIAWQVAEMIVKEITSVTLNGNTCPESQL